VSERRKGKQRRDAAERGGKPKFHPDCLLISPRIREPDIERAQRFRGGNLEILR